MSRSRYSVLGLALLVAACMCGFTAHADAAKAPEANPSTLTLDQSSPASAISYRAEQLQAVTTDAGFVTAGLLGNLAAPALTAVSVPAVDHASHAATAPTVAAAGASDTLDMAASPPLEVHLRCSAGDLPSTTYTRADGPAGQLAAADSNAPEVGGWPC